MKLRILATISACAFALAAPATAIARHHAHRHGAHARHHKRHAHQTRVLRFGATAQAAGQAGGYPNPSPTASSPAATAGTVASFAGGALTIKLSDGSMVSGKVTAQTRLRCEPGAEQDEAGEDQSGDDRAQASNSDRSEAQDEDERGDDGGGDEDTAEEGCAPADLMAPAVVREAELEIGPAGAVWEEVVLAL